MLSDAGQCSLRAAAAACYVLNVTAGHCLAALKSLLMCTSLATVALLTSSSCFIRFGHFISSSVMLSVIKRLISHNNYLFFNWAALSIIKDALLLSLMFRLSWEPLRCSASQEEELRGVTGGRPDPALLWKADQCPGEADQQPSTWTGKLQHARSAFAFLPNKTCTLCQPQH